MNKSPTLEVWKFPIAIGRDVVIDMPEEAKILTFQTQVDTPCLWVLANPAMRGQERRFRLYGTGHPIKEHIEQLEYIGSCQTAGGGFVWHLFEVKK